MISDTDIAYIAGLFDGEGSIYFARRKEKKKTHDKKETRKKYSRERYPIFKVQD